MKYTKNKLWGISYSIHNILGEIFKQGISNLLLVKAKKRLNIFLKNSTNTSMIGKTWKCTKQTDLNYLNKKNFPGVEIQLKNQFENQILFLLCSVVKSPGDHKQKLK